MIQIETITIIWEMPKDKKTFEQYTKDYPEAQVTSTFENKFTTRFEIWNIGGETE